MFGGFAHHPDFGAQGVVLAAVTGGAQQAVVLDHAALRYPVAAQVVVVDGVVFLHQLALAVPAVAGVAGVTVAGDFQPRLLVPAVAPGGLSLALPLALDQATVAVVKLALAVVAGAALGFPALGIQGAFDQGVAVHRQGVPAALGVIAIVDLGAVWQFHTFQPATGAVTVGDTVVVLMVFRHLALGRPLPAQLAVGAVGVAAAAKGVVPVVAADRLAVPALAGLAQYPARRVPLGVLDPEAGVFAMGDVAGGVVAETDIAAIGGRATVDLAGGVPAQLPLLAIGPGNRGQAFAEIVLVTDPVAIGTAVGGGPQQVAEKGGRSILDWAGPN